MGQTTEKFRFWCPLDISKAKNEDGEEVMRLGGIASTMDKDADGEFLDPSGFDIADFKKSGVVNWHHQSKNSPATIIGEPHKAEVRTEGFYVETDLYPSSELAQEVYALAQTLSKDSKTRRLGYSIEGTVIERDELNTKIVKQAKITGLAITHMPKNAQTFADIIKGHGHIDEDEEEEKSLSTTSGAAVVPESVDGYKVKNVSEEVMYDKIFDTFPGISIEKAEKVFEFLNKINMAMAKKTIENSDLEKAMSHLGLENLDTNPFLEKGGNADTSGSGDIKSKLAKSDSDSVADDIASKVDKEEYDGEGSKPDKKKEDDTDVDGKKIEKMKKSDDGDEDDEGSEMKKSKNDTMNTEQGEQILKAIGASQDENTANVKALAQLVKSQMDATELVKGKLINTRKELAETRDLLTKAVESIELLGGQTQGRKSLTKAIDKNFAGAPEDNLQKGGGSSVLNQVTHKRAISNILDGATFAKGFDEEFSKATTSFEAGNPLSSNVIARLKSEHGVIVEQ